MVKIVSPDSVRSSRTRPANLDVRSCSDIKLICQVRSSPRNQISKPVAKNFLSQYVYCECHCDDTAVLQFIDRLWLPYFPSNKQNCWAFNLNWVSSQWGKSVSRKIFLLRKQLLKKTFALYLINTIFVGSWSWKSQNHGQTIQNNTFLQIMFKIHYNMGIVFLTSEVMEAVRDQNTIESAI